MSKAFIFGGMGMVLAGFLLFAGTSVVTGQDVDGEALTNEKCSQCHGLGRVDRARERKGREGWERTVDRMISKRPGLLNDEQRDAVVDFLVMD